MIKEQPNWVTEYNNYGPSKLPDILRVIKQIELAKKYSDIIRRKPLKGSDLREKLKTK
jgi:hypothetical protein